MNKLYRFLDSKDSLFFWFLVLHLKHSHERAKDSQKGRQVEEVENCKHIDLRFSPTKCGSIDPN